MNTTQRDAAFKEFFAVYDMSDIKAECEGELYELGTDNFSFFFGNGELIVCDAHSDDEGTTYIVQPHYGKEVLVEY